MKIGKKEFDLENEYYIMGILNVTPDSFSDGGKWNHLDSALIHTEHMIADGATIIDIGGESTRPGHVQISEQEEIERVAPAIEAVREHFDIAISVDTYKAPVAEAAIKAGADLINDIWGFKYDKDMAPLAARTGVACCLMHNKDTKEYEDFLRDYLRETMECVAIAKAAGVAEDKIIIDPGFGFGKTPEHNLLLMKHLRDFCALPYPVLLGTSRKSTIGKVLDLDVDQRVEGTVATTVMGVEAGAHIFRVHDVKENYRAMKMAEAIIKA